MATASGSPTALKRWIAFELRRLRERHRPIISRVDAADRIGKSDTQVGHVETARNLPSLSDAEVLLGFYGVPERAPTFRDLIKQAKKGKDWWIGFTDVMPPWFGLYLGLEASAIDYQSYDVVTVPGLFQTAEYAEAVIRAGEHGLTDQEIARRVELRVARCGLVEREENPLRVWTVLDEAVLRRKVGGPEVLRAQIERLVELAERPNVDFQLLPAEAGAHAGVEGTFTILTFPPELEGDHGLAYVETRVRGIYYEAREEIDRHRHTLTRLQVQALPPEDTPAALLQIAKEIS